MNGDAFGAQWTRQIDVVTSKLKMLFFYSKFFPIFSLLFGVGISIQLLSMERKGTKNSFFNRRMFALFLFGVAHILFLWSGDVIHLYALLGPITLTLTNVKPSYLLIGSIALLLFSFYNQLADFLITTFGYVPESYLNDYTLEDIRTTIRGGVYFEGLTQRIQEYKNNIAVLYVQLMPVALAMFFLGLFIGKKRIFKGHFALCKSDQKTCFSDCYHKQCLQSCISIFYVGNSSLERSFLERSAYLLNGDL